MFRTVQRTLVNGKSDRSILGLGCGSDVAMLAFPGQPIQDHKPKHSLDKWRSLTFRSLQPWFQRKWKEATWQPEDY